MKRRRTFKLTPALALEHTAGALAIDPRALGKSLALAGDAPGSDVQTVIPDNDPDVVGLIEIHGPLEQRASEHMCGYSDGYDAIAARFEAAMRDTSISRVVMVIDSPGGDCAGLFEAVTKMHAVKAEIGKPVVAYADELAASAAYAIACVADEIYLPRSGQVGSVGCVGIHVDETEAAAKAGLGFTVFRSGARKFEGSSIEPLTEEAARAFQERIDTLAQQFFELVAASRELSVDAVAALDGAVFSGPSAVEKGLADGLATKEQAMKIKTKRTSAAAEDTKPAPADSADEQKPKDDESEEMKALRAENEELRAKLAKAEEKDSEEKAEDDEKDDESAEDGEDEESAEDEDKKAPAATRAAAALAKEHAALQKRVEAMEIGDLLRERADLPQSVREWCRTQSPAVVRSFLKTMPKSSAPRNSTATQGAAPVGAQLAGDDPDLKLLDAAFGTGRATKAPHRDPETGRFFLHTAGASQARKLAEQAKKGA